MLTSLNRIRFAVAIALFAALVLGVNAKWPYMHLVSWAAGERSRSDEIGAYQKRFEAIQPKLSTFKKIGYVTDGESERSFLAARFYLAPIIVNDKQDFDFILADIYNAENEPAVIGKGSQIVQRLAPGILLLRKESR